MTRTVPNVQPTTQQEANPFPEQICCTCRWWWKGYTSKPTGWCKRNAPTELKKPSISTNTDCFCGDWEENEKLRTVCDSVGGGYAWYGIQGTQRTQDFTSEFEIHEAIELGTVEWRDLV